MNEIAVVLVVSGSVAAAGLLFWLGVAVGGATVRIDTGEEPAWVGMVCGLVLLVMAFALIMFGFGVVRAVLLAT